MIYDCICIYKKSTALMVALIITMLVSEHYVQVCTNILRKFGDRINTNLLDHLNLAFV